MKNTFYLLLILFVIITGCTKNKNNDAGMADSTSNMDAGNSSKETDKTKIIREGVIDLALIDQNNDKKVFECPMDWNVLDDKAGTCPLCKMDLEEFTLAEAKNNLIKNDYQVK